MDVDHVGIAVRDLSSAMSRWSPWLSRSFSPPEEVATQKVRVSFGEIGSTHLELLEATSAESAIARSIEARGEGFHHLAFHVPSVDRALAQVRERGGRLVDTGARPGARGRRVGFAHPSAFGGVLVEFVEGP